MVRDFWKFLVLGRFWHKRASLSLSVAQINKRCKEYYHKLNLPDKNEHLTNFLGPMVHEIWKFLVFSPFSPFLAHGKATSCPPDAKTHKRCIRYYYKLDLSDKNEHSTNFISPVVWDLCKFLVLGPFWPKNGILGLSVAQIGKSCKEHYHKLDLSDQNEHSTYFI